MWVELGEWGTFDGVIQTLHTLKNFKKNFKKIYKNKRVVT
jgi:hypothetical protein